MTSYIVLRPGTQTNPSTNYRVVESPEWVWYFNKVREHYWYVKFGTIEEAAEFADKCNGNPNFFEYSQPQVQRRVPI